MPVFYEMEACKNVVAVVCVCVFGSTLVSGHVLVNVFLSAAD